METEKEYQHSNMISELLGYRDLLYFMIHREVKVLYKQTILGFSWAIIRPFMTMIIFSIIFGRLAKIPSDGIPYPVFSYTALFAGLIDFVISLIMLIFIMIYYSIVPTINIIWLPLLVFLMFLCAGGVGMWLSALSIQFRDIRHAIQFVTQLLMYLAPVVWPASLVLEKLGYNIYYFYALYPMVGVIEGFRACLIGVNPMPWELIIIGSISSALLFFSGLIYFKRRESVFADVA